MHKELIKAGEKVFVCHKQHFHSDKTESEKLREHIVVRANKSSFYTILAEEQEKERPLEYRFKQKNMVHVSGIWGFSHVAYRTKEEYEQKKALKERKEQLRLEIKQAVPQLSLKQLEEIHVLIRR